VTILGSGSIDVFDILKLRSFPCDFQFRSLKPLKQWMMIAISEENILLIMFGFAS